MVLINLLPWRTHLRIYYRKKLFKIIVACLMLACFVVTCAHFYLVKRQKTMEHRVVQLQTRLASVHQHAERQENNLMILAKLTHINQYAQTTEEFVRAIVNQQDLCFDDIERSQNIFILRGTVRSALALTAFLQNWRAVNLFSSIRINKLEQLPNHLFKFELQAPEFFPYVTLRQEQAL